MTSEPWPASFSPHSPVQSDKSSLWVAEPRIWALSPLLPMRLSISHHQERQATSTTSLPSRSGQTPDEYDREVRDLSSTWPLFIMRLGGSEGQGNNTGDSGCSCLRLLTGQVPHWERRAEKTRGYLPYPFTWHPNWWFRDFACGEQ